ncbi:MAG TPA: hypothetical protein VHD38_01885 [Candidatus Paceibacterota bacterium]|jgi:hypothetical protein|nr:hypothetical protein [Candidatus Paceibacterota bacterium]
MEASMVDSVERFKKYGQIFEPNEGHPITDTGEPESPYESLPYVAPQKRGQTALEKEQAELRELRGAGASHWD